MKIVVYKDSENLKKCKKLIAINMNFNKLSMIQFIKNGECHNIKSYAFYFIPKYKEFYYKGENIGANKIISIADWKKIVKKIKHLEKLNIFK